MACFRRKKRTSQTFVRGVLLLQLCLCVDGIVGRFFGNVNVVGMALLKPRAGDAHKLDRKSVV